MNTDIDFMKISENDKKFVREFEDFVNGRMSSAEKTGAAMTTMHRYLQQEAFRVCLSYIKHLAINCKKGHFDGRNEWASKTAKQIYDNLTETETMIFDPEYRELPDTSR